jgi:hypothetical protein
MPALPGSVALYLTALAVAERKVATIERALVGLAVEDLSFTDDGLEVTICRFKTDGPRRRVGIPYDGRPRTCPARGARLDRSVLPHGASSLSPHQPLRQNPALAPDGAERGADREALGRGGIRPGAVRGALPPLRARHGGGQSRQERALDHEADGHRSIIVVRRYIRDAELFEDNAAAGIGL